MDLTDLVAPDGTRAGDRIEGSEYLRGFCCRCREPMRVTGYGDRYMCRGCDPPHIGVGCFRDPVASDDEDAFRKAFDQ